MESGSEPEAGGAPRRLSEEDREGLSARLEREGPGWGEAQALEFLRNRFVDADLVRRLISVRQLLSSYRVKRAVALHPKTPQPDALRLLPHLRWHDLMSGGLRPSVPPLVKRSCDRILLERLPELALGERVSLAKGAGRGILPTLRFDGEPMVFAALLRNPRLVEEDLVSLVGSGRANRACLELIGRDAKWGTRPAIRRAMIRCPASPPALTVGWLSTLNRDELLATWRDDRTPELLRRAARSLLEARTSGAGDRRRR